MTGQEYLNKLVEECKVYVQKSIEIKDVYAKLFPESDAGEQDVYKKILSFTDDEMKEYFKASQIVADSELAFNKIANYVYFMKHIDSELDLSILSDVENLPKFIATSTPFETEFIIEEDTLKEKDPKRFEQKLELFKKSIKFSIDLKNDN